MGETVAGGTERRHEGRGDGHSRENRSALLAAVFQNSGHAAEKGDEDVVDGGAGTGLQFGGIHQRQGREQEKQRGSQQGDDHHHQQVFAGRFEQVHVVGAQRQSGADDGPHQRGHQHGTDDNGGGIHIQADGRQDDGEGQNPGVGAVEPDGRLDALARALGVNLVEDVAVIPDYAS